MSLPRLSYTLKDGFVPAFFVVVQLFEEWRAGAVSRQPTTQSAAKS